MKYYGFNKKKFEKFIIDKIYFIKGVLINKIWKFWIIYFLLVFYFSKFENRFLFTLLA